MKVSQYSTYGLNNVLRNLTVNKQQELARAQVELASGKHADVGLELGRQTGSLKLMENQIRQIGQIADNNVMSAARLSVMQNALSSMIDTSTSFNSTLTAQAGGQLDRGLLQGVAGDVLGAVTDGLNSNSNGNYLFSGINSDARAMVNYQGASGAPARAAVVGAFSSFFGFAPDDPAASGIDRASLDAFLDGPFAALFDDSNWQSLWSPASHNGIRVKISLSEITQYPSTAFGEPYREMVASSVMMFEFGASALSNDAVSHLATRAVEKNAAAMAGMAGEQGKIGSLEARLEQANERLSLQKDVIATETGRITNVDAYETATRINSLIVGLEASYSATARIQSLSILNYL